MAVITGICAFMFFKNINIQYNKWINMMGASTFGVLLIHANSDSMREWLWVHTLKNTQVYHTNYLFIHAITSVIIIFIICSILDRIRIYYIENPLFKKIDPLIEKLNFNIRKI
jgi:Trk-type K+ transport system membrane component